MSNWPAIFYSPHQDDEAIGFAGAIREHKDAGRPVYLVLLTNGINQGLLDILNGRVYCGWHQTYHNYQLTMEQLMWARKIEFVASAKRLGVDRTYIVEDGQGLDDVEPYLDYAGFLTRVTKIIQRFESEFPGASHKLVSGKLDAWPDGSRNPTHVACWDAAISLRNQITDFRFYRVYAYGHPLNDRNAGFILNLESSWLDAKREALNQYKFFNPDAGRFALGYHSVPTLIDAAFEDGKEYLDLLP